MAKNISLLGADYPDVPAVQLPMTGGGTATYYDINVVDNLESDSSTDALSAKQGKVLAEKMKLRQILYTSSVLSISAANGYAKVCSYSDLGQNLTMQNIVSVMRYSANFTAGATWFEVYSDGIYVYSAAAQSNKWIKVLIVVRDEGMESENKP